MTDKQMHSKNLSVELDKSRSTATSLIIDGVDVSECKYFSKYQKIVRNNECIVDMQNACIEEIKTKPCSQKHNCYFKNWQRKEQECEKAKQNAKDTYDLWQALIESFNILQGEKIKLEKENEVLKEELEAVYDDCKGCSTCNEALYNGNLYAKENKKLKQTLTEIKEIINEFAKEDILTFPDFSKEQNYKLIQKQCGEPVLKILQKINECEGNDDNI